MTSEWWGTPLPPPLIKRGIKGSKTNNIFPQYDFRIMRDRPPSSLLSFFLHELTIHGHSNHIWAFEIDIQTINKIRGFAFDFFETIHGLWGSPCIKKLFTKNNNNNNNNCHHYMTCRPRAAGKNTVQFWIKFTKLPGSEKIFLKCLSTCILTDRYLFILSD